MYFMTLGLIVCCILFLFVEQVRSTYCYLESLFQLIVLIAFVLFFPKIDFMPFLQL
uniref:Uncharacterized protein n=1 Tax=Anguilla anguilla TaxID=7936 RepID=A0A0E9WXB6_ANGAN